jgi:hypothetical protein
VKKTKGIIVVSALAILAVSSSCQNGKTEVKTVVKEVHDTVFVKDTIIHDSVVVKDTVVVTDVRYYEGRWLKKLFETSEWKEYKSYEYDFVVSYPEFMVKNLDLTSERSVFVEYKDVRLIARAYKDDTSVEEKFQELSKTATTKSMGDKYFMMAGKTSDVGRFFEKDIKMDGYWIYIRAEFPQEFTPYIDVLLQYVKNYGSSI